MSDALEGFGPPEPAPDLSGFGPPEQSAGGEVPPQQDDLSGFGRPEPSPSEAPDFTAWKAAQSGIVPADAASALTHAARTGLAPGFVADNLPAVKAEADRNRIANTLASAPGVASFAAQSHVHAAAVKDELASLSGLEWALTGRWDMHAAPEDIRDPATGQLVSPKGWPMFRMAAPPFWLRAFQAGLEEQKTIGLQTKAGTVGLTPAEETDLRARETAPEETFGAENIATKLVAKTARMIPGLGVLGAGTVAGGTLAGPPGAAVGAGVAMFAQSYGPLYRRLVQLQTPQGAPLLSDTEAKAIAAAGAAGTSAVSSIVGLPFLQKLPGVREVFQRIGAEGIAAAIARPGVAQALADLGAKYGKNYLTGVAMMAVQAGGEHATEEIAKVAKGVTSPLDAYERTVVASAHGAASALSDLLLVSAYHPIVETVGAVTRGQVERAQLAEAIAHAKASPLVGREPQVAAQVVDHVTAQPDAPSTAYVTKEAWDRRFGDAAPRVLADGGRAYAEADATGAPVAVPLREHLTTLLSHAEALLDDTTLSHDAMSTTEAKAAAERAGHPEPELPPEPSVATADVAEARSFLETKRLSDIQPGRYKRAADAAARRAFDAHARATELLASAEQTAQLGIDTATEAAEIARRGAGNLGLGLAQARELEAEGAGKAAQKLARSQLRESAQGQTAAESASVQATRRTVTAGDVAAQARAHEEQRAASLAFHRAANEIVADAERDRSFLFDYTKPAARAELGKATVVNKDGSTSYPYLEQVDRILAGIEFGQGVSRPEVGRRLATQAWIASEEAAGRQPVIPDSVLDKLDRFVHWKELSPKEMRDTRAAVESIARQAELKNTILADRKRVDAAKGKAEVVDAAFTNVQEHPVYQEGDVIPAGARVGDIARAAGAIVLRPEEYVRRVDGGKIDGPLSRYFWHPISEAYNDFLRLEEKWSRPIREAIEKIPADVRKRWRTETFTVAGRERTMEQAIVVALNHGNESNASKFARGYQNVEHLGIQSWTPEDVESVLSRLTREDWELAQTIGDSFAAAWPEIAEHERSLTGAAPEAVKPRPFARLLPDGTTIELRGWYYPVIYDPKFPGARAVSQDALLATNYTTAKTPQGRLNGRVEDYARPIALTLNGLPRVIREFAKDTAMREAVQSAYSVITDPTVRNALDRTIGAPGRQVLESAVRDSANDMALAANGAELALDMLGTLRGGVTASIFAFNVAQYLQNYSGFVQTLKHVPAPFVKGALAKFASSPSALYDVNRAESGEMAHRADHVNADTAQAIRKLRGEGTGAIAAVSEAGMRFWSSSDTIVSNVTYTAARDYALASVERGGLGYGVTDARRHAERTVRLALGSGRTLDLPSFLRQPVLKQLAPFSGWTSAMLNDYLGSAYNAREFWRQGERGKALREFQGTILAATALGLMSSVLSLKGPKDKENDGLDPADVGRWIVTDGILQPVQWMPYASQPVKAIAEGEKLRTDLFVPPLARPIKTLADIGAEARQKLGDDDLSSEDFTRLGLKGLEALASAKGLPTTQLRSTLGYLGDEEQPKDTALQVGLGVMGGKARKGKLIDLAK